jgi:hypothetical protein
VARPDHRHAAPDNEGWAGRRAGAMKDFQIPCKDIQTPRKEIQAGRNKIKIRRKEFQIRNPSISSAESSAIKGLRPTPSWRVSRADFRATIQRHGRGEPGHHGSREFAPIANPSFLASLSAPNTMSPTLARFGLRVVPFVFVSGSSVEQVKGWRHFYDREWRP